MPAHVRPALPEDLSAIGKLAAELVRLHHRFDTARFLLPDSSIEEGYERFLRSSYQRPDVVLLAAEQDRRIVGYAYGRLEPRDWNMLMDAHGAIHDIYVEPAARRHGIARSLVESMIKALEGLGARQLVLYTAVQNEAARSLFERLGFRPTMVEMTHSGDK